ncbi:NAD(P)H-binding protein [Methyloligella sp. 2.7D]|uniref:NAD(P)H-binding protein n=1 Tax=unclassified Methyloligella TaxID=2625955 RepID=UPI001ABB50CC|nr:NAD(P)H-binding protein [Methyloligella sp. GL2]
MGIAGKVGIRLAERLVARGDEVDGLYRRPQQKEALAAVGIQATEGDLVKMSAAELAEAIRGSDVVVFSAGAGGEGGPEMTTAIDGDGMTKTIEAVQQAGIARLILVSAFPNALRERETSDRFEHYMTVKRRSEVELVDSDLDWMILRPGTLTDDTGSGRVSLSLALPYGDVPRDDVAETLAEIVHAPGTARTILELISGSVPAAEAVATFDRA